MSARRPLQIGLLALSCVIFASCLLLPPPVSHNSPTGLLMASVDEIARVVEPRQGVPDQTLHARFKIVAAEGISKKFEGQEIEFAVQAPDRLFLKATVVGKEFRLGRNGQQLWIYAAQKNYCLIGEPSVPPFPKLTAGHQGNSATPVSFPSQPEATFMKPLRLPVSRTQLA